MDILAYGERNLARKLEENDKKIVVKPCRVGEREKVLKKLVWTSQIWFFLKPDSRVSIDRNRRRLLKIFKTISIDRKTNWINRNKQRLTKFWGKTQFLKKNLETSQSNEIDEQNAWVCDDMFFKNKDLSPIFPKLKFLTFSINFQASNQFCTKLKVFANLVGQTKDTYNNMYNV